MARLKLDRSRSTATFGMAALLAGVVVLIIALSSPVDAAGGGCETLSGWDAVAGSHISAARYRFCGETEIPLPVTIQRYQSPGVWSTVASGTGEATYYCSGSAFNRYRILYVTGGFEILCG